MAKNGLTDEQYASNLKWFESKLQAYPHTCWVLSSLGKRFTSFAVGDRCCAIVAPGYEAYGYTTIERRDKAIFEFNFVAGLPPCMTDGLHKNSARATGPQKVDFSAITREIVGRG